MRNSGDLCFPHKGLNETGSLSKFCMPSTAVSASLLLVHMRCGAGSNAQNPLEVGTCCRELATQFFGESCTPTVFVCVCSVVQSCLTLYNPWTAPHQASLSFTISWSLVKLMSIELVMPSNHLIPIILFSSHLQSFPASGSFPMSPLFTSGGQIIEASALASVLQWIFRVDFL